MALSRTPLLVTSVSVDGSFVQKHRLLVKVKSTLRKSFWALGGVDAATLWRHHHFMGPHQHVGPSVGLWGPQYDMSQSVPI